MLFFFEIILAWQLAHILTAQLTCLEYKSLDSVFSCLCVWLVCFGYFLSLLEPVVSIKVFVLDFLLFGFSMCCIIIGYYVCVHLCCAATSVHVSWLSSPLTCLDGADTESFLDCSMFFLDIILVINWSFVPQQTVQHQQQEEMSQHHHRRSMRLLMPSLVWRGSSVWVLSWIMVHTVNLSLFLWSFLY